MSVSRILAKCYSGLDNSLQGRVRWTYDWSTFSKVVALISLPEGISSTMETRFAKHSPALYARIPGAAISSISASKKWSFTKRTVEWLRAMTFKASSTWPLMID